MKLDAKAITKAARKDLKLTIPGSVLMYMANTIKEKHIQLMTTQGVADLIDIDADKLSAEIEANENVGCFLLGLIKESFGQEFLDMFIGDDGSPEPNAEVSNSVN